MTLVEQRPCRLESIRGHPVACPEEACPFWEPGSVLVPGGCVFEEIDLADNAELAGWLLRIRNALEPPGANEDCGG